MPKGYFFGEFEITDPPAYEVYRTRPVKAASDRR